MQTLTADEFKNKYGGIAASKFTLTPPEEGMFSSMKNDIMARGQTNNDLLSSTGPSALDAVDTGFKVAANTAGGVGEVAGEALKRIPVVGGLMSQAGKAIGAGFNAVTDKLAGTKFFQDAAANLEPGNPIEKGLSIASSGGQIAGDILGADVGAGALETAAKIPSKAGETIASIPKPNLGGMTKSVSTAVKDVVPTTQSLIDHNVAKALDLSPGDLSNIEKSTGNGVGKFLADNNLIGTNKATTQALIQGFFKQNYDAVRTEIGKVKNVYKMAQIPGYADALNEIEKKITGVPGLEKEAVQVDNLLHANKPITLNDAQAVKELLDKHFSLYKVTGDVGESVAKEGLANIRTKLKSFIETEVKKNTGEDISSMNNNVATSKSLGNAIETRSPKGLTRANLTSRDIMMGMGLTYFASPLVGVAAVFIKKLATSPTARLRFARYLDQKSDAYRAKISEALKNGAVPPEVEKVIEQ